MRFAGRVAVVVGAGQTPGDTMGNGRAISLLFAREGATVLAVDRDLASAEATCGLIAEVVGTASALRADIVEEDDCAAIAAAVRDRHGRVDVLVNNVGIGTGDASGTRLERDAWDLIHDVNVRGPWMTCKHVLPIMREQGGGAIVNVSSLASIAATPYLAYKTSKAALDALTHQLAMANAGRGIRVNAVLPGLMDTPMAIEGVSAALGVDKDELRRHRDAMVPLRGGMGTADDVANAVAFLASDDARFITSVLLPVDGGQHGRVG